MKRTAFLIAALFAMVLFAVPAYAGGNGNGHTEHASNGHGNNGKNHADPDGNGKNDDSAGDDGNNGSGNDPDCSDDNNGHGPKKCHEHTPKPPKPTHTPKPPKPTHSHPTPTPTDTPTVVPSTPNSTPTTPVENNTPTAKSTPEIGTATHASVPVPHKGGPGSGGTAQKHRALLPNTGATTNIALLLVGLGLISGGGVLLRRHFN